MRQAVAAGADRWPRGATWPLAAGCGYYDQAHLAREFRALAGCPPSVWLAEEFRFVQSSAADLGGRMDGMTQTPPPQVWPPCGPATPAG